MADAYDYVVSTGVIVPDTADILAGVQDEWRQAFGQDLVVTADTPQGVLITAEALARDGVARNNAAVANQINPNLAGGVFLDALLALMGSQRITATPSILANVEMTGAPNTILPPGAQARVGADGPIFETTGQVQLSATGVGTADFQALVDGPTAVGVGALDRIVSGVLGWEGVSNPTAAEPGKLGESDTAARRRRRNVLGRQSVALPTSIIARLFDVDGVRSVAFRENYTAASVVVDGVTLVAHSIYAAVEGGTDLDVATALLASKSLGANWNGDTTVDVTDPTSGQVYPVTFRRPDDIQIYAKVTVRQGLVTGDVPALVRAAIVTYASGELAGEEGFVIGADVSPFELAGAITAQVPGLYILEVLVGLAPGTVASAVLPITIEEQAKIVGGSIEVVVSP